MLNKSSCLILHKNMIPKVLQVHLGKCIIDSTMQTTFSLCIKFLHVQIIQKLDRSLQTFYFSYPVTHVIQKTSFLAHRIKSISTICTYFAFTQFTFKGLLKQNLLFFACTYPSSISFAPNSFFRKSMREKKLNQLANLVAYFSYFALYAA